MKSNQLSKKSLREIGRVTRQQANAWIERDLELNKPEVKALRGRSIHTTDPEDHLTELGMVVRTEDDLRWRAYMARVHGGFMHGPAHNPRRFHLARRQGVATSYLSVQ